MKKIFLFFFVIALVFSMLITLSVSGCKTITTEATTATTTTVATTAAGETTATATAAETTTGEVIELTYWSTIVPDSPDGKWFMNAISEYETAHPNIKINYEQQPSLSMSMMMQTLMAANAGPDMLSYWPGMNLWPLTDYLTDLKPYVPQEKMDELIDGNKIAYYYLYDESQKLLGLPITGNGYFLIEYSKKMFKEAGITWEPTEENRYRMSWDEFLDACNKLKAKGITPIGATFAGDSGGVAQWWVNSLSQNYFKREDVKGTFTGTIKANDPGWVETFARVLDLYKAGYFNKDALTIPWNEGLNLVNKGKAAMQPAYWGYSTSWAKDEMKDDFGMMLFPVIKPDNPLSWDVPAGVSGASIVPVWTKHPKEAADFITFLTSKDQYDKYFASSGGFPARKDFNSSQIEEPIAKLAYEMIRSEENTIWNTDMILPPEWYSEMGGSFAELLAGKISPQELCDRVETRMQTLEYPWLVKNK